MVSRVTQAMNLQPAPVPAHAQTGGSSLLGSFVIAARQRGVHLSVAQLIRDHQLRYYVASATNSGLVGAAPFGYALYFRAFDRFSVRL